MPSADSDEEDFMSDKFLQPSTSTSNSTTLSQSQTYAEKRRLAQRRAEDRGRVKSRAEREREAREEALGRDLILDRDDGGEGASGGGDKAVRMMMKMGFKPGQALGVKRSAPGDEHSKADADQAAKLARPAVHSDVPRPGLGLGAPSSSSSTPPSTSGSATPTDSRRTVPIGIHLRGPGRSGLGVPGTSAPPPPSRLPHLSHLSGAFSSFSASDQRQAYLSQARSRFSGRKAVSSLRKARRTLEELERREGVEENFMWRDPEEEVLEAERRIRRKMERGDAILDDDGEGEAMGVGRNSKLAALEGLSGDYSRTVVDIDVDGEAEGEGERKRAGDEVDGEEARREREVWMTLDGPTRLALTLEHLRTKHLYCLWCGAQYDTAEQMASECPGEEEDDH